MTPYEWISCALSLFALLISIPALIHLLKSRMRFKIKIEKFKSFKKPDGKFVNSFDLILINKNDITFSISNIYVKTFKKFEDVKMLIGSGGYNIAISPNFNDKIEQFYFVTDFQVRAKLTFKIITNRKQVLKTVKLNMI